MIAQFSIWPLDEPHMSDEVEKVDKLLERHGLKHEVGPMGTTIEGSWPEVMKAIEMCHELVRESHSRVLTNISIDDNAAGSQGGRTVTETKAETRAASQ